MGAMMDIQLNNKPCILKTLSLRTENHGERKVLACDIAIEFSLTAEDLAMFHVDLRKLVYKAERYREQPDLLQMADPDALSCLRHPQLNPLRWHEEVEDIPVSIQRVVMNRPISLTKARIDKWTLECFDGGEVGVSCRIQSIVDEEGVGRLSGMLGSVCEVSVHRTEHAEAA
jgi:hypothetical protein